MESIINPNTGNFFFTNYTVNGLTRKERRLVQIELDDSLKPNPMALTNARLLATFLIRHPDDTSFSGINQRFWTQYHKDDGRYDLSNRFHLVCPTNNDHAFFGILSLDCLLLNAKLKGPTINVSLLYRVTQSRYGRKRLR